MFNALWSPLVSSDGSLKKIDILKSVQTLLHEEPKMETDCEIGMVLFVLLYLLFWLTLRRVFSSTRMPSISDRT